MNWLYRVHEVKFNNFDFLRLYLALAVLWHHYFYLIGKKSDFFLFNLFDPETAVRAFFVISGALIWRSAEKTTNAFSFFKKRFFRIYPAYFTVIIISSVFALVVFDANFLDVLKYMFWNSMFLNFVEPCIGQVYADNLMCAQNGSLWTLKIEVAFYVFVYFSFYILKLKPMVLFSFAAIVSFLLHVVFVNIYDKFFPAFITNQLPFLLFYFFLGAFFMPFFKTMKTSFSLIITFVFAILYYYSEFFYPFFIVSFVFFIAYALPFYINVNRYGDLSYGCYIYHFPLIQLFFALGFFNFFTDNQGAGLVVLVVLLVSFLSWRYIERPSLDMARS